jgi:Fe-S-cluster-containing hydrogenase component 2
MRIRIKHRYPDLPTPAFQPMVCRNCEKPKCVEACPKNALEPDEKDREVKLIEARCDACGKCVEVCPFHAIWVDPLTKIAIKCDLCGGLPKCVEFCRFGAISFAL